MCLAIPARILSLIPPDKALAELGGVRKEISTSLLDAVSPGDYVLVHVGFALSKLDPEEAKKTLELFAQLYNLQEETQSEN
ncbi:MAG: HypC/HybG/HupF family hydrogenase formation chaperone [Planctomycetota bacterium]